VKRKALIFIVSFLVLTPFVSPIIGAMDAEWDYSNYLTYLNILTFEDPVEAGSTGCLTIEVGANIPVTVHYEFKASYSWGEWIYYSEEVHVDPGVSVFTVDVEVPFKTVVEPTCSFYYYVYVTLPGEGWTSDCWGFRRDTDISLPSDISLDDLHDALGHLAWMVESSDLSWGVKGVLLSRIGDLAEHLDTLYSQGESERIHDILEFILTLRESLCSGKYSESEYWCSITEYFD